MYVDTKNSAGSARTVFVVALLSTLLAVVGVVTLGRLQTPSLPVLSTVPDFSLLDRNGKSFGSDDLSGRVWVASFLYTSCPGPCPVLVERIHELDRSLVDRFALRWVSFSVDPDNDTPAVLAAYAESRGIPPGRWKLLTGGVEEIVHLVREGFRLVMGDAAELLDGDMDEAELEQLVATQGPVVHSVHLALVDAELRVRGYYDSSDTEALDSLRRDIATLLPPN